MSGGDWFRWAVMALCVFNIGVAIALFERVAKSFLPKLWIRLLVVSQASVMAAIAVVIYSRVGEPMSFRTPMFAATLLMQVVALVGMHHWYGTAEGRTHSARMMKGR